MRPSFDRKSGLLCRDRLVIGGGISNKLERAQIEAKQRLVLKFATSLSLRTPLEVASLLSGIKIIDRHHANLAAALGDDCSEASTTRGQAPAPASIDY